MINVPSRKIDVIDLDATGIGEDVVLSHDEVWVYSSHEQTDNYGALRVSRVRVGSWQDKLTIHEYQLLP